MAWRSVVRAPWPPLLAAALGVAGVLVALLIHPGETRGPADAVLDLMAARVSGSCADYVATTTALFRNDMYLGSATCDDFAVEAAEHAGREPVVVEVASVVVVDAAMAEVETLERYRQGAPDEYAVAMAYRTRLVDGVWLVDHVDLTVLPD